MSEINYSTVQYYLVLILIFIYLSLFVLEKKWPLRKATRPLLPRLALISPLPSWFMSSQVCLLAP